MAEEKVSRRNEDLLEAIYEISHEKGYAKSKDIAAALHITPATVTDGFKRLQDAGLVNYEPYGGVTLTKAGSDIAIRTHESHLVIRRLLKLVGVDEETANNDACIMEHGLSDDSYERIIRLVDFIEECCKEPGKEVLFNKMVLKR